MKAVLLLLCALVLPFAAAQAVTLGSVASADDAALTGYTADPGNERLVVFVSAAEGGGGLAHEATAVTYGGLSLTRAVNGIQGEQTTSIWYLQEPIPAGSNDFIVTHNGGIPASRHYAALTLQGVDQASPVADSASAGCDNCNSESVAINAVSGGLTIAGHNHGRPGTTTWAGAYVTQTDTSLGATATMSTATHQESVSGATVASATVATTADRSMILGALTLRPSLAANPGDRNNDGTVDILDVALISTNLGRQVFDVRADANSDGVIDLFDLVTVARHWGWSAGSPTDDTPPSQVSGLSVTATTSSSVTLSWNAATDNVGVTGYQVYRGGILIATISATSYTDMGLSANTTYNYTVAAQDARGNIGTQSSQAQAVTQTVGSSTEPSYVPSLHLMVYQDDMERYTDAYQIGDPAASNFIAFGTPVLRPYPSPANYPGWGPEGPGQYIVSTPGRDGTGRALRINRPAQSAAQTSGSLLSDDIPVPANTDNTTHYFSYWARVQMNQTLTGALDVKWFMAWHNQDPGNRIQWMTHYMWDQTGTWQRGQPLYWGPFDGGSSVTVPGAQPIGPYPVDVFNGGQWHRYTYAYRPHSAPGAGDGIARMWIDGTLIVDCSQAAVGITPPGGEKEWCSQSALDQIFVADGLASVHFLSTQTTSAPAWTFDVDDLSWWVERPPDTTPPGQVGGLSVTATTTSSASLSWNVATDDVGVAGYLVYRNGTLVANTTGTVITNSGLSPNTTYAYVVAAYDAAGNEGPLSAGAQAVTQASVGEPFYTGAAGQSLVFEDDMESYDGDFNALGTVDTGVPRVIPNPSPLGGTGTFDTGAYALVTGRDGTGQALRIIRDGVYQSGSSLKTTDVLVPPNTDNVTHYFQHWSRVQMASPLTSPLNVKWFMAWHNDGTRIQWNTFWAMAGLPDGGRTYWMVYDQGATQSQGMQPVGPIFTDIANGGEWHRYTYAFRPNSAPGARDGFARMWVDGTRIIDISSATVGVTPPGGGKIWANWDDVDALATSGIHFLNWPSVQTTTTPAWTMDTDDLVWWTE